MNNRQVILVADIILNEKSKVELSSKKPCEIPPEELLERGLEARRAEGWCDIFAVPLPAPVPIDSNRKKWAIVFHRHHHKI